MSGTSAGARATGSGRASDARTNEDILQDLRRDVLAADDVTNKALDQLDHQTEQIRGINNDVDSISATMDQAAKIIKGMSPIGMIRQAVSGRHGQAGAGRAECKWMWRNTKVPSLFGEKASGHNVLRWSSWQGLEDIIQDIERHKAENRRILCKIALPGRDEDEIEFDNPRDAVEKIRDLLVLQQQAAFAAIGNPGSLSSSSASAVAPYSPPRAAPNSSAASRRLPGQQEEALLADIEGVLDGMNEKTQQMNRTLNVQNQMLPAVAEKMERERLRAEDQTRKLQKMQGR